MDHNLKVVHILEDGRWGGPQSYSVNVGTELKERNIDVTIMYPKANSDRLAQEITQRGLQFIEIKMCRLSKYPPLFIKYVIFFVRDLYVMHKALNKIDPGIIHCHGCWQIKGLILSRFTKAKTVWHLHSTYAPKLLRTLVKIVVPLLVDSIIVVSDQTKKTFVDENFKNINVPVKTIPSPVDTNKFDPSKVNPDKKVSSYAGMNVVTVGSINPLKGMGDYVNVAKKVSSHADFKVNFFIVGNPTQSTVDYYNYIMNESGKYLGNTIHFIGESNNVSGILKGCDLYLCTSNFEASPIAVREAMSMALPVISTDVGDVKQLVEKKNRCAGTIVQRGDLQALFKGVIKFLANDKLRRRLGKNARLIAINELDTSICAERHSVFYERIMYNA